MDSFLGLLLLAVYIVGVVSLAAFITYLAVKIFPTKDRPDKKPDAPTDDGAGPAGRLYRRARRGLT